MAKTGIGCNTETRDKFKTAKIEYMAAIKRQISDDEFLQKLLLKWGE